MRNLKRLTAAILTAALALSLAALPASAATGSFTDVSDADTALNADILRLMGVVSGTGGGSFNPNDTLTRAQFCTMVVPFLQKKDEVVRYSTRTIFSDVKSDHWARGYINLAASIPVTDGEGENGAFIPLISGVGDGRFLPDENITISEAATILLRALGYTSKEAGAVWPQGYMDLAVSVGLTEGLDLPVSSPISRAQAARLFVNALSCKASNGKVYYENIGAVANGGDKAIILAVNVQTDDGSTLGAIRTTGMDKNSESYLPAYGSGNVAALQGKRGYLVLNDKKEVVAFVPDRSTATTIVLSGDAQAGYVKSNSGQQYTVSSGTTVYSSATDAGKSYLEAYSSLTSGMQITMYSEKGKIVAIYATGGASTIDSDAVVVMGSATAATFHRLTGGVTNFNIVKNRQSIYMNQIKPYDVATYDPLSNTLVVSDLRMTAVYTSPTPNPKTPTKITVVGQEMDVLQSAWDTIGNLKPGDNVSLLLTADGKVAGIVPAEGPARSTAIGTASSGGVSIFLPNGGTLNLSGKVANIAGVASGAPVVISSIRDAFSVSSLSTTHAPGAFDVSGLKLGGLTVSPSVRIYEQGVKGSPMRPVDLGSLTMESIPANKISYHANSTGTVDYIILDNVTGVAYIYGMMVGGYEPSASDPEDPDKDRYVWNLRNGSQGNLRFSNATAYRGSSGDMVGVITSTDRDGNYTIREVVSLQAIQRVKASDFFDSQGDPYVRVGGRTYRIADNVECYYNRTGNKVAQENWLTGGSGLDRFNSIKAYSETYTIYVDPVGQQVRVIVAN